MRKLFYLFILGAFVACGSSGGNAKTYEQTIGDFYCSKGMSGVIFKALETGKTATITVADSVAILNEAFEKERAGKIGHAEGVLKMMRDLQEMENKSRFTKPAEKEKTARKIAEQEVSIDSLKQLTAPVVELYQNRNGSDLLAEVVTCSYSLDLGNGRTVEETSEFYLSPDGETCYGYKKTKR